MPLLRLLGLLVLLRVLACLRLLSLLRLLGLLVLLRALACLRLLRLLRLLVLLRLLSLLRLLRLLVLVRLLACLRLLRLLGMRLQVKDFNQIMQKKRLESVFVLSKICMSQCGTLTPWPFCFPQPRVALPARALLLPRPVWHSRLADISLFGATSFAART